MEIQKKTKRAQACSSKPAAKKSFGFIAPVFVIVAVVAIALFFSGVFNQAVQPGQIACTLEAKICPDGSAVGRSGPDCEFSPCPTASPNSCDAKPVDSCQQAVGCAVCPPCAACSSISCHSAAFCKSIGFDENWYNLVANSACSCPKGYIADNGVCNPNCYYLTPKCLSPSIACTFAK